MDNDGGRSFTALLAIPYVFCQGDANGITPSESRRREGGKFVAKRDPCDPFKERRGGHAHVVASRRSQANAARRRRLRERRGGSSEAEAANSERSLIRRRRGGEDTFDTHGPAHGLAPAPN